MKKGKLLNKLNTAVDSLYESLYKVRDVIEEYEDSELDELAQQFIEQVELCISEGDVSYSSLTDFIEEIE